MGVLARFSGSRDKPPGGPEEYTIRWWDLGFEDPELERGYRKKFLERSLPIIRWALILGVLVYASFVFLDILLIEHDRFQVWAVRFGFVCPALALSLLWTYRNPTYERIQVILTVSMLAAGTGVVLMTALTAPPTNYLYYAGILDTVVYCSCVMRLRFILAAPVSLLLLIAYQLVVGYVNPIPPDIWLNNSYFFVAAVGVSTFAVYSQEFYMRVSYSAESSVAAERDLARELRDKAEMANRAKSDFLAIVSHELRTPLNAIIGFSDVIRDEILGSVGDERYRGYAQDINRSGQQLLELIDNIINLSNAEAGRLMMEESWVDVEGMTANVMQFMNQRAREKGVAMECACDSGLPLLKADRRMVQHMLLNLMSNAVKFSASRGQVRVTAYMVDDGSMRIDVTDKGKGMGAEDLSRVMESFVQAEGPFTRNHEGIGLGLPLARKMIELHGGQLELKSIKGSGTTASLIFPAVRSQSAENAQPGSVAADSLTFPAGPSVTSGQPSDGTGRGGGWSS